MAKRITLATLAAVGSIGLAAQAMADEHVVVQKKMKFNPPEMTVALGDKVVFKNEGRSAHNVFIKKMKVDSKLQKPGDDYTVEFSKAGTYEVGCHIHPRMKMTVVVK